MNSVKIFLIFLLFALPSYVWAQGEGGFWGQSQITHFRSSESEQKSLIGADMFLMKNFGDSKVGVSAYSYHDDEYWNGIFGATYDISSAVQFGLGIGKARYADESWTIFNPWLFLETDRWEGMLYAEYVPSEQGTAKWFWKYHLQYYFGESRTWFAGVYGDRFFGDAPMFGYAWNDHVSFWVAKPFGSDFDLFTTVDIRFGW